MKVKDDIFNTIRYNYQLKKVISDKLNTPVQNVYLWCVRKQHRKVGSDPVKAILREFLNITDEQIEEKLNKL